MVVFPKQARIWQVAWMYASHLDRPVEAVRLDFPTPPRSLPVSDSHIHPLDYHAFGSVMFYTPLLAQSRLHLELVTSGRVMRDKIPSRRTFRA